MPTLDSQTEARRGIAEKIAREIARLNPTACVYHGERGVYVTTAAARLLLIYSWAITGALVDLGDTPLDVTDYTDLATLTPVSENSNGEPRDRRENL